MPMLGIMASQISGHLAAAGDYESIATVTVGTAVSSVTFSSIAADWKHLQIRGIMNTSTATNPTFYYNTDVVANGKYYSHHLWGTGAAANANAQTANYFSYIPSTSYPAAFVMDILDYTSTTKNKTARTLTGSSTNGGTEEIALWSSLWFISPQAINQVTLLNNGGNFATYSSFALYGIKG